VDDPLSTVFFAWLIAGWLGVLAGFVFAAIMSGVETEIRRRKRGR
jgi:hypothetical protein